MFKREVEKGKFKDEMLNLSMFRQHKEIVFYMCEHFKPKHLSLAKMAV